MKRRIKDILEEAELVTPDGYMTYHIDDGGVIKTRKMYIAEIYDIEEYGDSYTSPLYKGARIAISRCLTPLEMKRDGIVEETKKRVFLSVLQGIFINHKPPIEDRVHLWTEEREGFTYVFGEIKVLRQRKSIKYKKERSNK